MRAHYVSIAECDQVHGTAVVIDVLRAFSTAAWAFHLGVERIVLTADLDDALRIKASIPRALAMKDARPMDGFELSNSPVELQAARSASRARRSCSARRTGPSGHGQPVPPSNSTAPASSSHRQPLRPFVSRVRRKCSSSSPVRTVSPRRTCPAPSTSQPWSKNPQPMRHRTSHARRPRPPQRCSPAASRMAHQASMRSISRRVCVRMCSTLSCARQWSLLAIPAS